MSLFPISGRGEPVLAASGSERRAHTRFSWQGTAVIRILPHGPDVLGVLLDVSESGCGIEIGTDLPAKVGAQVMVDLQVRGETLKRAGVIRRIDVIRRSERETRTGIEFVAVNSPRVEPVNRPAKGLFWDPELESGG